jgi:hypothetical protein
LVPEATLCTYLGAGPVFIVVALLVVGSARKTFTGWADEEIFSGVVDKLRGRKDALAPTAVAMAFVKGLKMGGDS